MARRLLTLGFLAAAASVVVSTPAVAQYDMASELPGPDKPPFGRSLLDYLMLSDDGTTMDVPFPFEQLVARLASRTGVQPKVFMVPKGRSLQRDHADFAGPRIVVGFTNNGLPGGSELVAFAKNRFYLGYAERANQIEAITYNAASGRYEFQIIKDYKQGGKKQIAYADRTLCVKCHRNGAPMFGPAPWKETTAWDYDLTPSGSRIAHLTEQAVGAKDFHGQPIAVAKDVPYDVTRGIKTANSDMPHQRLWTLSCGGDAPEASRCRANVLQLALEAEFTGTVSLTTANPAYQALQTTWKTYWATTLKGGLQVPGYKLPEYDPLAASGQTVVPTGFADLNTANLSPDQIAQLQKMLQDSSVPKEADPLVMPLGEGELWVLDPADPRAAKGSCFGNCLIFAVHDFLADSDRHYLKGLAGGDFAKVTQALDALVAANDPALGNRPFRRGAVVKALAARLGDPNISGAFYDDDAPTMPPPVLDSEAPTPEGGTPLALMQTYCVPCHQQLPGNKGFLSGASEAEILTKLKGEAAEIYKRLDWDQPPTAGHAFMPPATDAKRAQLQAKPDDRQKIMQWIKGMM